MNIYSQISLSQDEEPTEGNFIPMISDDDEPYLEQTDLPVAPFIKPTLVCLLHL